MVALMKNGEILNLIEKLLTEYQLLRIYCGEAGRKGGRNVILVLCLR